MVWNRRSKWVLSRFSHPVYLRIQFRLDNTLENQQNNLLNITKVFYPFCFLLSPLYQLLSFIVHHRLVVEFFHSLVIFSSIFQSSWLAAVLFDFFSFVPSFSVPSLFLFSKRSISQFYVIFFSFVLDAPWAV